MAARDKWAELARGIQARTWAARPTIPGKASELYTQVKKYLIAACDGGRLKDGPHAIHRKVKLTPHSKTPDHFVMTGGLIDGTRFGEKDRFERPDGAAFDFSITVRQEQGAIELLAYDFEIRLPKGLGPPFLRFDLNLPQHANENIGLRSHVHPGVDEDQLMLPAPVMSPIELLALFVEHLEHPKRVRADRAAMWDFIV